MVVKFASIIILVIGSLLGANVWSEEPTIVRNEAVGLWEQGEAKKLELKTDLTIGAEDGSDNELFYRVYDIAVSTKGRIYVLDNGLDRVQVYDSTGSYQQTIGRKGEGPGEFFFPTAIAVDPFGRLYVADQARITVFDEKGNFLDDLRHGIPDAYVRSIRVDINSGIYISCFHLFEQQIIHKFSPIPDAHGDSLLISFCDSYARNVSIKVRHFSTPIRLLSAPDPVC